MENPIYLFQVIKSASEIFGTFYVIENFPHPQFVLDEEGIPKSFDSYNEAFQEAEDCQNGYVIAL